MRVLVTGATGYLGSHTVVELVAAGHEVIGVDDFSNSARSVVDDIEAVLDQTSVAGAGMEFVEADIANTARLDREIDGSTVDAVVHFAGRKYVAESVADPIRYYDRNVGASAALFSWLQRHGVGRVVFSSSCTVYGQPERAPVDEGTPIVPISPYGRSKVLVEEMLEELCRVAPVGATSLRYFNPIGAHPSGLLGDRPSGPPNNLVPFIMEVATGQRPVLQVFGDDYDTPDGTCLRDYIHALDLARAHVDALDHVDTPGYSAINIGTGVGRSVLEVLDACRDATGHPVPHEVVDRRPGDAGAVFADPARAHRLLGWSARLGLAEMCRDHWRFAQKSVVPTTD